MAMRPAINGARQALAPCRSARGSVAVMVALTLSMLLVFMAFVLDAGYLYSEKNRYQNAVEAAAMAGAISLCQNDAEETARRVAKENGITKAFDASVLNVAIGYYDENDMYAESFTAFTDFAADPNPQTPENEAVLRLDGGCCQYNNAVMIRLVQPEKPLIGAAMGDTSDLTIRTAAVAYLRRYGFLALGEEGLQVSRQWADGHPVFQDLAIHSNGPILFGGTETFSGETSVTASDQIIGGPGIAGIDPIEIAPVDWDNLMSAAQANGRVYQPADWSQGNISNAADWQIDDEGNEFLRSGRTYFFCPANGDLDGATYYFASQDEASPGTLIILNEQLWRPAYECRNFTIAAEMDTRIGHYAGGNYTSRLMTLGGPGNDAVHLYAQGDIVFRDRYASFSPVAYQCNALVMVSEKKVTLQTNMSTFNPDIGQHCLRIIADSIVYENRGVGAANLGRIAFDGLFAPPCPPRIIKLGRLVPAEEG
ncbi:MAG: pilus assembly protein [Desulfosarcina sp.]|nr:pilus assembly protein [Desulfobacterales bacterium]